MMGDGRTCARLIRRGRPKIGQQGLVVIKKLLHAPGVHRLDGPHPAADKARGPPHLSVSSAGARRKSPYMTCAQEHREANCQAGTVAAGGIRTRVYPERRESALPTGEGDRDEEADRGTVANQVSRGVGQARTRGGG